MKIIHACWFTSIPSGVLYQMKCEQRAALELGIDWKLVVFSDDDVDCNFLHRPIPFKNRTFLRRRAYFSKSIVQFKKKCDIILVRYSTADPYLVNSINKLHPCLTVHHTKEYYEIKSDSSLLRSKVCAFVEDFYGSKVLKKIDGIIGVTEEILNYERARAGSPVPGFVLPNGISLSEVPLACDRRGKDAVRIAFVASSFAPWHGLDKVLSVLQDLSEPVVMHVVGAVPEKERNLIARHPRLRSQVLLHGLLDRNALASVLEECDCSLSSFALERKNMREAATLKVRESLAAGIPVLSGHRDAAFPEEFPFYKKIDVQTLPEALETVKKWREVPRERIRSLAAPFIDKKEILRGAYRTLLELFA